MKIKNIKQPGKYMVILRIKFNMFFHYLPYVFKKKLDIKHYILLLQRINTLLKTFKSNKFYKIGKLINIDNSVPMYPSDIFFKFTEKFTEFENKLPCSNVLLSITKDCSFSCKHCYQKLDEGKDIEIEVLNNVVKDLLENGVTNFKIEGGDPFIKFDRLESICKTIGYNGEISINSTGNGITLEKLKKLKSICNLKTITFSMNSPIIDDVNFFMGQDYAWNTINHGLKLCKIANVATSLNCCLHSGHFENGNFEYLMEIAKDYGVAHVMLIAPKAAGAWLQGNSPRFTPEEINHIISSVKKFNKSSKFKKYPAITAQVMEEDKDHYGCAGGGTDRFYINAKGDVQPCEFLNISFGNIKNEKFMDIFNKMRNEFKTPGTTWLCDSFSEKVFNLFQNDQILPLNEEKSALLYGKWNRGDATNLYYKIEKELNLQKN